MVIATQIGSIGKISSRRYANCQNSQTDIGYRTPQGWVTITILYRHRGGWMSDTYPGWHKTVTEWKKAIKSIFSVKG